MDNSYEWHTPRQILHMSERKGIERLYNHPRLFAFEQTNIAGPSRASSSGDDERRRSRPSTSKPLSLTDSYVRPMRRARSSRSSTSVFGVSTSKPRRRRSPAIRPRLFARTPSPYRDPMLDLDPRFEDGYDWQQEEYSSGASDYDTSGASDSDSDVEAEDSEAGHPKSHSRCLPKPVRAPRMPRRTPLMPIATVSRKRASFKEAHKRRFGALFPLELDSPEEKKVLEHGGRLADYRDLVVPKVTESGPSHRLSPRAMGKRRQEDTFVTGTSQGLTSSVSSFVSSSSSSTSMTASDDFDAESIESVSTAPTSSPPSPPPSPCLRKSLVLPLPSRFISVPELQCPLSQHVLSCKVEAETSRRERSSLSNGGSSAASGHVEPERSRPVSKRARMVTESTHPSKVFGAFARVAEGIRALHSQRPLANANEKPTYTLLSTRPCLSNLVTYTFPASDSTNSDIEVCPSTVALQTYQVRRSAPYNPSSLRKSYYPLASASNPSNPAERFASGVAPFPLLVSRTTVRRSIERSCLQYPRPDWAEAGEEDEDEWEGISTSYNGYDGCSLSPSPNNSPLAKARANRPLVVQGAAFLRVFAMENAIRDKYRPRYWDRWHSDVFYRVLKEDKVACVAGGIGIVEWRKRRVGSALCIEW